ncbi:hypothetical protein Pmani_011015 [Petrolisthes manimaculis]|uniref:Uncharacterized protein n=1 Tax=Petrolisthes manimaculis TaxID=1843537 RepID=A0AAE1Q0E3_9EUCA|nr:hypothetical protein Pmani_011015 [Petrolisthes manimaculis]
MEEHVLSCVFREKKEISSHVLRPSGFMLVLMQRFRDSNLTIESLRVVLIPTHLTQPCFPQHVNSVLHLTTWINAERFKGALPHYI